MTLSFRKFCLVTLVSVMTGVTALLTSALSPAQADKLRAEELVTESELTVRKMWNHPEFSNFVRRYLKQAKGVVLVPNMLKAGFIVGGEGGSGVLLARAANGDWSYPSFVNIGGASIGLQVGGSSSEVMLIILTGKGLESVMEDRVQIGAELSGAAGPYGSSAEAATTTNLDVDMLVYSISSGAYVGVNLEGGAIVPRESFIQSYYGTAVSPKDIVINGRVGNPQADKLRTTLRDLVGP